MSTTQDTAKAENGEAPVVHKANTIESPEPVEVNATEAELIEKPEVIEEPKLIVIEMTEEQKLKVKLDETLAKLRTVSKAYSDMQKEMLAVRKRAEAQAELKSARKLSTVVSAFFEPVQNLKRAVEVGGDSVESILTGIQMVIGQFDTAMDTLGLEEIPGVGAIFNPDMHEAIGVTPAMTEADDGRIVYVSLAGYWMRGKTLQPAKVIVGKYEKVEEPPEAVVSESEAVVSESDDVASDSEV